MKTIHACPVLLFFALMLSSCAKNQSDVVQGSPPMVRSVLSGSSDNRVIDFENASLAPDMTLTDDSYTYAFITKGTYNNPYITNTDKYRGCNSIVYSMPHTAVSGSVTNDKSQHRIFSGSDANALTFGTKKYFGLAFKIDSTTEQPTSTVQIFQVWQGTPMSPPLELRLLSGGTGSTFNFQLWVRNNTTTANPSAGISVYQGTIQKGVWNTFVIMTIMRNTADTTDGEIKLWTNGTLIKDWFGRAGYASGIVYAGTSYTPNTNFDSFFGPYRPCQAATLKFFYDEVRYEGAYADANPDVGSTTCN
ncbi:heparin lyase I family protein [Chitinophagaceae bacterium LWZ2-11]